MRVSNFVIRDAIVPALAATTKEGVIREMVQSLHGAGYFPELQPVGEVRAQMFHSSPSGGSESMQLMYLMAITAATRSIDIGSAYFVPDQVTRRALVAALRRGVKLRVITPGRHTDQQTVRRASRALWGELLEAGAEIHEYQPTMFHNKMLIVDKQVTSVGSTNFDLRSFRLNDEANLNIFDAITSNQAVYNYNLLKVGQGTLTFSGSTYNDFSGNTAVLQGVLQLNKSGGALAVGLADAREDDLRLGAGLEPTAELSFGRDIKIGAVLGHAPEHACLFCPEANVLISGDQVLPKITTNVSVWPGGTFEMPE